MGLTIEARRKAHQNFKANRLAQAIRCLNAALGELEEARTPASGRAAIAAERRALFADFRATAAEAGWEKAMIEEVTE